MAGYSQKYPLVSYNGLGFDLPAMRARAMIQDIPINNRMYSNFMKKWEGNEHHFDLMRVLLNFDYKKYKKLDFYLHRLKIGSKTEGMDGSKVYAAFQEKRFSEIQTYCEEDVLQTARLFARVEPWIK